MLICYVLLQRVGLDWIIIKSKAGENTWDTKGKEMALTNCPECKTEISDKAATCPKCGHPMQVIPASAPQKEKPKWGLLKGFLMVLGVLFLGFIGLGLWTNANKAKNNTVEKPALPIEVGYRKALLARGLVATFKNDSNRNLSILATFENPTMHQKKSFRLDLAPGGSSEFGHLEGWNFESGDLITLEHNDYSSWKGKFP